MLLFIAKKAFCNTKLQKELLGGSFQFLIFDSKLDILPKPIKETLAILKSALKLPITNF